MLYQNKSVPTYCREGYRFLPEADPAPNVVLRRVLPGMPLKVKSVKFKLKDIIINSIALLLVMLF